jgi:uncharacterized membrane protein
MDFTAIIHLVLAFTAIISGAVIVARKKGDLLHARLGKIFVASMVLVNLTAFSFLPKYGFTIFQPLALWSLICVTLGYYFAAKKPNKNWLVCHFYFITYAYAGVVAAALARIPLSFGLLVNQSALISIAVVFSVSIYFIEKHGKKLRTVKM